VVPAMSTDGALTSASCGEVAPFDQRSFRWAVCRVFAGVSEDVTIDLDGDDFRRRCRH